MTIHRASALTCRAATALALLACFTLADSAQASEWRSAGGRFGRMRAPLTEPAFEWRPDKVARRSYGEMLVWETPARTPARARGVEVLRAPVQRVSR